MRNSLSEIGIGMLVGAFVAFAGFGMGFVTFMILTAAFGAPF